MKFLNTLSICAILLSGIAHIPTSHAEEIADQNQIDEQAIDGTIDMQSIESNLADFHRGNGPGHGPGFPPHNGTPGFPPRNGGPGFPPHNGGHGPGFPPHNGGHGPGFPPHNGGHGPGFPHPRPITCYAKNGAGRVFGARGFYNPNIIQREAMRVCFKHSRRCRPLGCRL